MNNIQNQMLNNNRNSLLNNIQNLIMYQNQKVAVNIKNSMIKKYHCFQIIISNKGENS